MATPVSTWPSRSSSIAPPQIETLDTLSSKPALAMAVALLPNDILYSWVEVYWKGEWYNLEGHILEKPYLMALQSTFADCSTTFCGYGVYTDNSKNHLLIGPKNIPMSKIKASIRILAYSLPLMLFMKSIRRN